MPYVNLPPRLCPRCGVEFRPKHRPDQVYCSRACANTVRNQANRKAPTFRPCRYCGVDFVVRFKPTQYCSRACALKARWAAVPRDPEDVVAARWQAYQRSWYKANKDRLKPRRRQQAQVRYGKPEVRAKVVAAVRERRHANIVHERAKDRARAAVSYATLRKRELGACQRCGYNRYLGALEWHHRDPSTKTPGGFRTKPRAIAEPEIAGCVLLCANCHKELHHGIWCIEEIDGHSSVAGEPEASGGSDRVTAPLPTQSAAR